MTQRPSSHLHIILRIAIAVVTMVGPLLISPGCKPVQPAPTMTPTAFGLPHSPTPTRAREQPESPLAPTRPAARSPVATPTAPPSMLPTVESPLPTPSSVSMVGPTAPLPTSTVQKVAPDFTLPRAGGGTFTLSRQLARGPVVLVFFQKCG
jgi:hypothetical protein